MVRMPGYWNTRRISAESGRRGIHVGHGQVDRLIARCGTDRTSLPREPGPRHGRTSPNEPWHIDPEGPFFLPAPTGGRRTRRFVALVDDLGRFLLGIRAVPTREAVPIPGALAEAVELAACPRS